MNKGDMINLVAEVAGISKVKAGHAVDMLLGEIIDALDDGHAVSIRGFGTFMTRTHKARAFKSPRDGKTVEIKARKLIKFRPSKSLTVTV